MSYPLFYQDISKDKGYASDMHGRVPSGKTSEDILLILTGKSGSGKTTQRKELEKVGFAPIITSTTRLPREGEKNNVDYFFLNNSKDLTTDSFCLVGINENGDRYGIKRDDLHRGGTNVLVTGSSGVMELSELWKGTLKYRNMVLVYLDFSNFTLIKRLYARGDNKETIRSRLISDTRKFDGFNPALPTLRVNTGTIEDVKGQILQFIKK